ncbi:MAG: hypothetical protein U5J98_00225 [Halobacteriales archaeon]|nr:hypothetical protein [Halobacteriales archaeon]
MAVALELDPAGLGHRVLGPELGVAVGEPGRLRARVVEVGLGHRVQVQALVRVGQQEREGPRPEVEGRDAPIVALRSERLGGPAVGVDAVQLRLGLVRDVHQEIAVAGPPDRAPPGDGAVQLVGQRAVAVAVPQVDLRRPGRVVGVVGGEGQPLALRVPFEAPGGDVAVGEPLDARAVRLDEVDVHRHRVVRAFGPVREEGDAGLAPRRLEAAEALVGAAAVGVVEPLELAALEVAHEQVARHRVLPADAVELVLEPLGLDGAVLLAQPLEVLGLLVGRVAGGDHDPLAVGRPVELADPLLAVGDLPGVAPALEVEHPELGLRFVALERGSLVLVVLRWRPAEAPLEVRLAGADEAELRAVGAPAGLAGVGGPGQPVGRLAPVGRDDEQRAAGVVLLAVVLGGDERRALAVRRERQLGRQAEVVVGLERDRLGHGCGAGTGGQ